MKNMMTIVVLLALAGCGSTKYYNENVTQAQAEQDTAYCQLVSMQAGGLPMDMASAAMSGIQRAKASELCFISKGYVRQ